MYNFACLYSCYCGRRGQESPSRIIQIWNQLPLTDINEKHNYSPDQKMDPSNLLLEFTRHSRRKSCSGNYAIQELFSLSTLFNAKYLISSRHTPEIIKLNWKKIILPLTLTRFASIISYTKHIKDSKVWTRKVVNWCLAMQVAGPHETAILCRYGKAVRAKLWIDHA